MQDLSSLSRVQGEQPISSHSATLDGLLRYSHFQIAGALGAVLIGFMWVVVARMVPMVVYVGGIVVIAAIVVGLLAWAYTRFGAGVQEVRLYPSGVAWREKDGWHEASRDEIEEFYRKEKLVDGEYSLREVVIKVPTRTVTFTHALKKWKT